MLARNVPPLLTLLAALFGLSAIAWPARADDVDEGPEERAGLREIAERRIGLRTTEAEPGRRAVRVQLLSFNDFHGQISAGRKVAGRPVGGAAVLAAYLEAEQRAFRGTTFIVHAGDHVGASPPASALLQDEPAVAFLNMLGNKHCRARRDPRCNVIGTLGNHEFDEGVSELMRLLRGGNHVRGPFLDPRYHGALPEYVCSNVVDAEGGKTLLEPFVVRKAQGVPIGFIGAVLKDTPSVVTPSGVAGVRFLDEAESINAQVAALRRRGVETIVVLLHQGGRQTSYAGPTQLRVTGPGGAIAEIVKRLDSAIDVVVSGHAHAFTNAFIDNAAGKRILVTQAFSASTAYGDIELTIDPRTRDVVESSAAVITTFADEGPGLHPDQRVAALVKTAEDRVAARVQQVVGSAPHALSRTPNAAGESALGNLLADAQRAAMQSDIAFINPGGIRADLPVGPVTWGQLFTVLPFGNHLVRMQLLGSEIAALLEQQWSGQPFARVMQVSGLGYSWNPSANPGERVTEIHMPGGKPFDRNATYSVTVNSFMAAGGDNFSIFTRGRDPTFGPIDLDALVEYVKGSAQSFDRKVEGRIRLSPAAGGIKLQKK
jgi:5'-nucleotidase